jgi:PAS domain S-box-containing protein
MAIDQSRAIIELLYHVSREVATALDLRTVLQRVVYETIINVGGERGSIVVLDDHGKPVDATIVYGKQFHEHTTQQIRDTVDRGLAGWVIRNRKAVLVNDTSKDERWLRRPDDAIEKTGAKSAMCVPLLARERLVGVLTLVHSTPYAFNQEHLELMQAIADQAGIAVLNGRLYAESQRQARVMTALAEGAKTINASLQLDEVLQRITDQTMQALQVEMVAIGLIDQDRGDLVFKAAAGVGAKDILGGRSPLAMGIIGMVLREGRGVVIPMVDKDKRVTTTDLLLPGARTQAIAAVPIQAREQTIGILQVVNPKARTFDPDALLVLAGIGSLAGTSIQNAQLYERLQVAHQNYRDLFEDSIDPILITTFQGRIVGANRQAAMLSGYSPMDLKAMTIDQMHEVNWNRTGLEFEHLRTSETQSYESTLHRKDGRKMPIEVYVRTTRFEDTDSLQWILRDITERKDLDALREDLTAMIYHDLRSPLANIVSSIDILSGMLPGDETIASLLEIANQSTGRIQRLISSLLDINRLEAGHIIVDQQAIDPAILIGEAREAVRYAAESRQQIIKMDISDTLPLIWVDPDMVRRVFINLLENAIKFTSTYGVIEIGASLEGEKVLCWVKDNGPGISPADQDRVFEKFTRLKKEGISSGLGVGLAFCRLAVLGHGGQIWIDSELGKGARFNLTLPVANTGSL